MTHAYYYQNGVQYALPNLPSVNPGGGANAINDKGQIVGVSNFNAAIGHAVLWQNGQITDLYALGVNGDPIAINNNGVIVGNTSLQGGKATVFAYANGQMTDILAGTNLRGGYATGLNDAGDICGYGYLPNGQTRAFLATPNAVPEPGTPLLCAVGVGVLALAARRRKRAALAR